MTGPETKILKTMRSRRLFIWFGGALVVVLTLSVAAFLPLWDRDRTSVELIFLGDTAFGENYQDRRRSQGRGNILLSKGYNYLLENFGEILSRDALVIANLETPITNALLSPLAYRREYVHYGDIDLTPRYLTDYNVSVVSLANNHAMDYGRLGLEQTVERLSAYGIEFCGAGMNEEAAAAPWTREILIDDQKVRLMVFCTLEYRRDFDEEFDFYADQNHPGVNLLSVDRIESQIRLARETGSKVFAIAFPHWVRNYEFARKNQQEYARSLIDAGVDILIGHGAHMFQDIDFHKGRWIIHGLGNFVFAAPGRYEDEGLAPYGAITRIVLRLKDDKVVPQIFLYPIFIDNRVTNYKSRFLTNLEFDDFLSIVSEHSSALAQKNFGRDVDRYGYHLILN